MKRRIVLMTSESVAEQVSSLIDSTSDLELGVSVLEGLQGLDAAAVVVDELEGVHALSQTFPVLVVSDKHDDTSIFAALQAGARGYVLKTVAPDVLLRSIRAVANGEAIFCQGVAERVSYFFTALPPRVPELFLELTPREQEIMRLLVRRFSTKDMARRLELRPKTIRNHVSNIVSKLNVKNRNEAVELATEEGFQ